MTKLLVCAEHPHGPLKNGEGGCQARWGNGGMCPGVETANWLNGLGEDDEQYSSMKDVRNIDVRLNWTRNNAHIVPLDKELEDLKRRERTAQKELRSVRKRIRELIVKRVMES
jgi:hypothetical protein